MAGGPDESRVRRDSEWIETWVPWPLDTLPDEMGIFMLRVWLAWYGEGIEPVAVEVLPASEIVDGVRMWTSPPLGSGAMRSIRWGEVFARAREKAIQDTTSLAAFVDTADPSDWRGTPEGREIELRESAQLVEDLKPLGRPAVYDREDWEKVAATYRDALEAGSRAPTKAVQKKFEVSHSTAADWVAKCRKLRLLPPTSRGLARG